MSVPPGNLPGPGSIFVKTAEVFAQMASNMRDNVPQSGADPKISMGVQALNSATALPAMFSKSIARVNVATSALQGGQDVVMGFRKNDPARTGSGVMTIGMIGVGALSGPVALGTGSVLAVATLVAPDKVKVVNEKIGQAVHTGFENFRTHMASPPNPASFDILKNLV